MNERHNYEIREVFMNLIKTSIISAIAITGVLTITTPSAGATDRSSCIDGTIRSNLKVTWVSSKSVLVGTVGDKPLCEDLPIYFSSYTMPDNYNGKPFQNNPTASPQAIFDNTTVILKKDEIKSSAMTITLPEACKNTQVDVYYGPKIETVTAKGHGSQYISGKILNKTQETCKSTVPVTPAAPETPAPEAQTPETPAPVVIIPTAPAELPKTGGAVLGMTMLGSILAVTTYAVAFVTSKRN